MKILGWLVLAALLTISQAVAASQRILIENVHVFDSRDAVRSSVPMHVLINGPVIEQVSEQSIEIDGDITRFDAEGRTLIPGLIDAHWHAALAGPSQMDMLTADPGYLHLVAGKLAETTLLRGFTSVRDMGGPTFGLRRAIEQGVVTGPRIFPAGAMISQTGGHGDFRLPYEVPRAAGEPLSHTEKMGGAAIADGADEVLRRTREQLMLGATHIKLMAGGGVSSLYDPLDVTQYTPAELEAAVAAAENWGTYVAVHAYTPRAIRMAIDAGVKSIEHGQLVDEETARYMAEQGVWWSLQPFLDDQYANPQQGAARQKQLQVAQGTDRAYELAQEYGIAIAFGTDILFSGGDAQNQMPRLLSLQRWFSPNEILQIATYNNGQLLRLSGPRYPYPGDLGVIEPGAMADLLLVDGNPLENMDLLLEPERNFSLIIKHGQVLQNTLH